MASALRSRATEHAYADHHEAAWPPYTRLATHPGIPRTRTVRPVEPESDEPEGKGRPESRVGSEPVDGAHAGRVALLEELQRVPDVSKNIMRAAPAALHAGPRGRPAGRGRWRLATHASTSATARVAAVRTSWRSRTSTSGAAARSHSPRRRAAGQLPPAVDVQPLAHLLALLALFCLAIHFYGLLPWKQSSGLAKEVTANVYRVSIY